MKRADIALGHVAAELALGEPSPAEVELGAVRPLTESERELASDFLYFHLTVMRRCEMRMDAQNLWTNEYADLHRQHVQATAAAGERYRQLAASGGVPGHLVDMAMAAGLKA